MEVRVCKNCRRLFQYRYGPDLCPECTKLAVETKANEETATAQAVTGNKTFNSSVKTMLKEEETKFEQVKTYIMLNPKVSVAQIAEANGITPAKLFEWIRDDRLEFSEDSAHAWLTCEKCGTKIKSGRFCSRCKKS